MGELRRPNWLRCGDDQPPTASYRNGSIPWSDGTETDPALLGLADVDVTERGHRDDVAPTLLVAEGERATLLQRLVDHRGDLLDALARLERQLASDVLDADPDLHCGAFRWGAGEVATSPADVGDPYARARVLPHSQLRVSAACSTCSLLGKPPMPRQASWPMTRAASSRG